MVSKLLSASFLLPFLLASPMILIGQYGLSLAEILVLFAGLYLLTGHLIIHSKTYPKIPKFILIYTLFFSLGWLGAFYNGDNWGIAGHFNFLYLIFLPLLAYHVGRYSGKDLESISTNKVSLAIITVVGIVAGAYPFLTFEMRQIIFRLFVVDADMRRLISPRFPGVGINGVLYSFMIFIFLLFSFNSYLRKHTSLLVPLFAAIIILVTASKLTMILSFFSCLSLIISKQVSEAKISKKFAHRSFLAINPKAVAIWLSVICLISLGYYYADDLEDIYIFLRRLDQLLPGSEGASPLDDRMYHWALGMERVMLAPFLGIPIYHNPADDTVALYFGAPHNEFIFYWMAYGFFGLVAHIYLISYFVALNIRRKAELPWIMMYLALMVQMFFDSAFQGVRFVAMFFVIAGLNINYLQNQKKLNQRHVIIRP